jgi:hypothetical protein
MVVLTRSGRAAVHRPNLIRGSSSGAREWQGEVGLSRGRWWCARNRTGGCGRMGDEGSAQQCLNWDEREKRGDHRAGSIARKRKRGVMAVAARGGEGRGSGRPATTGTSQANRGACPRKGNRGAPRREGWRVGWFQKKSTWAGPKMNNVSFYLFKIFSTNLNFKWFKEYLPMAENFQINYGFVRN